MKTLEKENGTCGEYSKERIKREKIKETNKKTKEKKKNTVKREKK